MRPSGGPPDAYYRHQRSELLGLIEGTPRTVLEVGCATGRTLAALRNRGAETWGLDVVPAVEAEARRNADHFALGDVEAILGSGQWPFEARRFDCLVLGDVLEHLRDPWTVLGRLVVDHLEPGAQIVSSVPNLRFYGVIFPLLFLGRFDYRDEGILDRTHLRFFTRSGVVNMFEGAGLTVKTVRPRCGPRRQILNRLTLRAFEGLLTLQVLIRAVKP